MINISNASRYLFIILCLFLTCLSGCGFHLRGQTTLPAPLQRIYIKTSQPYGELSHNLRQYLEMSGAYVADTPQGATTVLNIISDTTGQQLLGVTGTQQTRQYNFTVSVTFQLTNPDDTLLTSPETLTQSRTLPINASEILSGSNQANALYRQMRKAIVFDIMNRISSQQVTNILTKKPTRP